MLFFWLRWVYWQTYVWTPFHCKWLSCWFYSWRYELALPTHLYHWSNYSWCFLLVFQYITLTCRMMVVYNLCLTTFCVTHLHVHISHNFVIWIMVLTIPDYLALSCSYISLINFSFSSPFFIPYQNSCILQSSNSWSDCTLYHCKNK